jgi:group I intron endonuclease
MEKKFNYVYLTTNLITGKQYIGDHSSDTLNDEYLGSGSYIISAIKKYGKENFKKEILEHFNNKQSAFNAQESYIKKFNTHVSQGGYNISEKGGHQVNNSMSQETKNKIRKIRKGKKLNLSPEQILRRSVVQTGKYHSQETKEKIRIANIGKKMSDESKEKNKIAHLGKKSSEQTCKKLSEMRKGKISWNKGIPNSDEHKKNQSLSLKGKLKGRKMSEEFKLKIKKSWEKRRANALL